MLLKKIGVDKRTFVLRFLILTLITAVCMAADQWTKVWATAKLYNKPQELYFYGLIKLLYAENTGAWGSMGSNLPEPWRYILLTIVPILFLCGVYVFTLTRKVLKTYETICYALIIGGGAGNLIDRAIHGFVVDFLWMGWNQYGTNIFNVADVLIMTGVITLLLWQLIFDRESNEKTSIAVSKS